MHPFISRTALLGAAVVSTVVLAGCSAADNAMPGMDHNATPVASDPVNPSASGAPRSADVMFARMMIPHHQQAVEMADIALSKTSASSKVQGLATAVKSAQEPEMTTLTGWLTSWGAKAADPTAGMNHGTGMMTTAEMSKLKAAEGTEFDRLWLTLMISHHEGAVTMARQVLTTTTDQQVKKLANDIVTAQQDEITTMRSLLAS